MPRPEADVPLVPSILDRVIDLEPRVSTEPPAARARQLAQIKESVERDLEWLLNSKRTPEPVPTGLPHLERREGPTRAPSPRRRRAGLERPRVELARGPGIAGRDGPLGPDGRGDRGARAGRHETRDAPAPFIDGSRTTLEA
jgi:hypothetical protein